MSDVDGLNIVHMDGSLERRKDLARRLRSAGLSVDTDGEEWRSAGSFISGRLASPSDGSEVNHQETVTGMVTGLDQGTRALIIVQSPRSGLWPQAELKPAPDGRFSSKATFGGSDESYGGKDYILMIALASQAASASLRASGHPLSSLPPDVRVLDQATVIRRISGGRVSAQPAATGRITRPRGGRVKWQDTVTGLAAAIPPDSQAWILIQTPQRLYWPQARLMLDREGGFASEAIFGRPGGRDSGEEFVLMLALASPTATASFQSCLEKGTCVAPLPPDALVLDQVTVIRDERQEFFTDHGTTLFPGERLSAGQALWAHVPDGLVRFSMRGDGDLEASYRENISGRWHTLWETGTGSAKYLAFREDGNIVLCAGDDTVLIDWHAEGMGGKRLMVQGDANVVLYSDEDRAIWATDRLKNGMIVPPAPPGLRALPQRRVTGPGSEVRWVDV
jgi:hypothetical protein